MTFNFYYAHLTSTVLITLYILTHFIPKQPYEASIMFTLFFIITTIFPIYRYGTENTNSLTSLWYMTGQGFEAGQSDSQTVFLKPYLLL